MLKLNETSKNQGLVIMRYYCLLLFILMMSVNAYAQDTISTEILNHVNETRQTFGIIPLVFSPQLQIAAQNHSDDMARFDQLNHVGSDGSQFWERMQSTGYPLTVAAENILSRSDTNPESVFNQWFNSESHRLNMLNDAYVEVGIAYARADSGRFYFTMVLGARADFVAPILTATPTNTPAPATIPPTFTPIPTIPITITSAPTIPVINSPIPIQTTSTISPTQAPNLVTNTPRPTATEFIPPEIRLIYDENTLVLVNISGRVLNLANLVFESNSGTMTASRWNTEFLSQPLSGFTNNDCLQVWTVDTDYLVPPDDCHFRHGWIAVAEDTQFWRNADIFTVRSGDDLVGICRVDFGICEMNISTPVADVAILDPATFGQLPDLRFEYSDNSFALINVSGRPLDLTGLFFRSDSGTLAMEAWNTEFLSQALNNFSNGDCLQVWTPDYPNQPSPTRCRVRHGWILVNDSGDFWRQTDNFTIEQNGVLIGRCFTNEDDCTVSLSDNFGLAPQVQQSSVASPTNITSSATSEFDIQIEITPESFTLINTSGRDLDISGYVFQGELGTFSAQRWQIPALSTSLTAFPSGDCLQIWVLGATVQAISNNCGVRHGWAVATQNEFFWIGDRVYEVWNEDILLASCEMRATICNFNLP